MNAAKTIHEGHNVKRIREILGIKQDALAVQLGLSQQAVSQLEQKEVLDAAMLEKVSKALGVAPEAIKSFNEDTAINIVSSTFNDNASVNYYPTFNPIDKIIELYERMLKEKDAIIEKFLNDKK